MKRVLVFVAVVLISTMASAQARSVKVCRVLQEGNTPDGQKIRVEGYISNYNEDVSHKGAPFTAFKLNDGCSVSTNFDGHLGLHNGQTVVVTGHTVCFGFSGKPEEDCFIAGEQMENK